MSNFGGIISVRVRGGANAAHGLLSPTQLFSLAGVESLIGHPATMNHASIPLEIRAARGVDDGLVRRIVGMEDVKDLTNHLATALGS